MEKHVMRNPIIPGFYPDPSICRVGEDFYLACSSFELYPGIPIFHSKDLCNWEQIGYAMTKENGFHVGVSNYAAGVMAPTIRYHKGIFYIINCNFSDKENFIVTATDPAGPWSQPHWLPDVPGIDASLFFDDDDKCYVVGRGNVVKRADGTTDDGIWAAEFDIDNFCVIGERIPIWDSALRVSSWPEAPHLYHIGDYYYLMIAEGGTEHYHSVAVARSKTPLGWYEGNPANPVMTHRQFGFHYPITNVGHADFVDTPDGKWYAVMLATRTVDGMYKNLGRESFICPVLWERDWPIFSPRTGKIEWEYPADESLKWTEYSLKEPTRDDFDSPKPAMHWAFWGTPYEDFWHVRDSKLFLRCLPHGICDDFTRSDTQVRGKCVSFIGRRQRQINFDSGLSMSFTPKGAESAGMVIMQASNHQIRVERAVAGGGSLRKDAVWQCEKQPEGTQVLRLVLNTFESDKPIYLPGFKAMQHTTVLAEIPWTSENVIIHLHAVGEDYTFSCAESEGEALKPFGKADARLINPETVNCMVGILIGMYASANHTDSDNEAAFDWFTYED